MNASLSTGSSPSGRNAALKLFGIGVLTLIMAIPLLLISSLVSERRERAAEAQASIAQGWGGEQSVAGPFLIIPYLSPERRDETGALVANAMRGEIVTLAKTLNVEASPAVEERRRGIFTVPVYAGLITLTGTLSRPDLNALPAGTLIEWNKARLAVGVQDVRGISDSVALTLGSTDRYVFNPGTGVSAMTSGVQTAIALPEAETPFTISFRLRGTGRLAFVPSAETFSAKIESGWPHPSFDGAYLPETREVSEQGFKAVWRVSHLSRALPQLWDNSDSSIAPYQSAFGATFFQPVEFYQLVDRSLKYAILFIGLSFLVFFLVETVTCARVHVVQYLLAGAAQVIFYLLLLALAEQTGFAIAYLAAAAGCIGLTTLYAGSVLGTTKRALSVSAALTVLYALLYTLLNEEDYALLTGAVASFLALAITMFLTRNVDWYQAQAVATSSLTDMKQTPPA
jgi:inner membrane protein